MVGSPMLAKHAGGDIVAGAVLAGVLMGYGGDGAALGGGHEEGPGSATWPRHMDDFSTPVPIR